MATGFFSLDFNEVPDTTEWSRVRDQLVIVDQPANWTSPPSNVTVLDPTDRIYKRNDPTFGWSEAILEDVGGQSSKVINGNFDIWQLGNGAFTADGYTADMWQLASASGSTKSLSKLALSNSDNSDNCAAIDVTSGAAAGSLITLTHYIEKAKSYNGKIVTVSFDAFATASGKFLSFEMIQFFGTGGSPSASVTGIGATKIALTTVNTRYTVSFLVPSITGKTLGSNNDDSLQSIFWLDAGSNFNARTGSLGNQSGSFRISAFKINEGVKASKFVTPNQSLELLKARRYLYPVGDGNYLGIGAAQTAANIVTNTAIPVSMRAAPTLTGSGGGQIFPGGTAITALSLLSSTPESALLQSVASGMVAKESYAVFMTAGSKYYLTARL